MKVKKIMISIFISMMIFMNGTTNIFAINQECLTPEIMVNHEELVIETKMVKTGDNSNNLISMGSIGIGLLGIYCLIMKKFIQ